MKLELKQPDTYDEVANFIDAQDWSVENFLFLVVTGLDRIFREMDPEVKEDILKLLTERYKK